MSRGLCQIQDHIKNLRQEISDTLQLAQLNNQSIICLQNSTTSIKSPFKPFDSNKPHPSCFQLESLTSKYSHSCLTQSLKQLASVFESRTSHHLHFLITKQIQSEEQSVRRDRLSEYEDKVYDQRRLISDKEVFLESLYRPKKQRPQHMSSEEFLELRTREKIEEERLKLIQLDEEIKEITVFRKKLLQAEAAKSISNTKKMPDSVVIKRQIELYSKIKKEDLQKTKSSSIQVVNTSSLTNPISEKLQKIVEEEEIANILPNQRQFDPNQGKSSISETHRPHACLSKPQQLNGLCKDAKGAPYSQKALGRQVQFGKKSCFSVEIERLIHNYEKDLLGQEGRSQKLQKIVKMMEKIQTKKGQNRMKESELRDLQKQNMHMYAHLNKLKSAYLPAKKLTP